MADQLEHLFPHWTETERCWGVYGPAILRWEKTTGRLAPPPTQDRGRMSLAFEEWMMGLPPGHVTYVPGLSYKEQQRLLGNGVVPQQVAYAWNILGGGL